METLKVVSCQCRAGRHLQTWHSLWTANFKKSYLKKDIAIWYSDLKLPVHICTQCIDKIVSMLAHFIRHCTSLKPTLAYHSIYWAVFDGIYTQAVSSDRQFWRYCLCVDTAQADSAAEQLILKSRIFRGRSLGSAWIWRWERGSRI